MSDYPDFFSMQPSLLAQIEDAKERGLSLARVVQDRETAQALGWSQNLVADNRDEADNLVAQQAISQSELFKSWAAEDAEKAAIAREDYAMLSQGFNLLEAERKRQARRRLAAGRRGGCRQPGQHLLAQRARAGGIKASGHGGRAMAERRMRQAGRHGGHEAISAR